MAVYLDHNATSPPSPEHLAQLFSRLHEAAGNPSSPHAAGRSASVALTEARRRVASAFLCEPSEVIFVSGGSEANNIGTKGVLRARAQPLHELHVISSAVEHPCVLEPLRLMAEQEGLQLTLLPVDHEGRIRLPDLQKAIRPNTALIAVMVANNESGSLQPMHEFAQWLHAVRWSKVKPGHHWRHGKDSEWPTWARELSPEIDQAQLQNLHLHVDAVQAWGKIPTGDWYSLGFDSVSVCAHKLGGVAGVGALLLRRGRKFEPLVLGGAQERSRRAGTENMMGILSLGMVAETVSGHDWWEKMQALEARRERLLSFFEGREGVVINTPRHRALPNTLNICIQTHNLVGEDVLMELDLKGFYASSGSACSSGANRPSHVLKAQGRTDHQARNGVRFSMGPETSDADIEALCRVLTDIFSRR